MMVSDRKMMIFLGEYWFTHAEIKVLQIEILVLPEKTMLCIIAYVAFDNVPLQNKFYGKGFKWKTLSSATHICDQCLKTA